MGWAQGFAAGSQMGERWINIYNAAKDRQEQEQKKAALAGIAEQQKTFDNPAAQLPVPRVGLSAGDGMGPVAPVSALPPEQQAALASRGVAPVQPAPAVQAAGDGVGPAAPARPQQGRGLPSPASPAMATMNPEMPQRRGLSEEDALRAQARVFAQFDDKAGLQLVQQRLGQIEAERAAQSRWDQSQAFEREKFQAEDKDRAARMGILQKDYDMRVEEHGATMDWNNYVRGREKAVTLAKGLIGDLRNSTVGTAELNAKVNELTEGMDEAQKAAFTDEFATQFKATYGWDMRDAEQVTSKLMARFEPLTKATFTNDTDKLAAYNLAISDMLDPDVTDNIDVRIIPSDDGQYIAMYGDKPLGGVPPFDALEAIPAFVAKEIERDPVGRGLEYLNNNKKRAEVLAKRAEQAMDMFELNQEQRRNLTDNITKMRTSDTFMLADKAEQKRMIAQAYRQAGVPMTKEEELNFLDPAEFTPVTPGGGNDVRSAADIIKGGGAGAQNATQGDVDAAAIDMFYQIRDSADPQASIEALQAQLAAGNIPAEEVPIVQEAIRKYGTYSTLIGIGDAAVSIATPISSLTRHATTAYDKAANTMRGLSELFGENKQ